MTRPQLDQPSVPFSRERSAVPSLFERGYHGLMKEIGDRDHGIVRQIERRNPELMRQICGRSLMITPRDVVYVCAPEDAVDAVQAKLRYFDSRWGDFGHIQVRISGRERFDPTKNP
jgi:hypothetical protein